MSLNTDLIRQHAAEINIEHAVFNALDCTVLSRQKLDVFVLIHKIDTWSNVIIKKSSTNRVTINVACLFLTDFLIDAELFWARNESGILNSGFWTEQLSNGNLLHFEALACISAGQPILIIKNVAQVFAQQQRTLQAARETLISNETLQQQVDDTHQRINETISTDSDDMQMLKTISNTIDKATFGIMVLNHKLNPILQNPLNYRLFQLKDPGQGGTETPISIIFDLMKKQYPEYQRIFESATQWHGELYWLAAPHYVKWLKVSIYPIKDTLGKVTHWVLYINDISRIKHLLQHNEKLAHYDSLTQLPNRQLFWSIVEQNCMHQEPFYLLYIDIDNFKFINENYGHAEGDELLIIIAQRLQKLLKKEDVICRIGGDEFAVILKNVNGNNSDKSCMAIAQRVLTEVNIPYKVQHKDQLLITASIGVVHFPDDSNNPDLLVKYADLATYNAKLTGKSDIKFYSQELQQKTAQRISLENALREAINNDEFEVLLQPIMDIASGKIIKAEALVRWQSPDAGRIMPNDFIPLAEETGLIIPLGKLVFKHVCRHIKLLQQLGYHHKVSVNLSPKQIYDNSFSPFVYHTLTEYDVPPEQIEFEITESSLANNFEVVLNTLQQLKKGGVSISVDDFGTGYSSLAYLKRLPVDYLKIDRSFIIGIANDGGDQAIVSAVIVMAHSLKLKVIAEGVENVEQLKCLTEMNCDAVQGYLFSRPVDLNKFTDFLQDNSK